MFHLLRPHPLAYPDAPPQKDMPSKPDSVRKPAILFVCTANRIRSPLAEHILFNLVKRRSKGMAVWRVESAGVWAQEGLGVLPEVYQAGLEYGLDLRAHRTQTVASIGLHQFDLILAMEQMHEATICNEFPQLCGRVMTLGEALTGYAFDVADPRGHTPRAVRATTRELVNLLTWGFTPLRQRVEALAGERGELASAR